MDWEPDAATHDLTYVALETHSNMENAVRSVIGRIMAMRGDLRQHGRPLPALWPGSGWNTLASTEGMDAVRSC